MRSNYNEEKVPEIHTIRGKSLDECKNKLNKSLNGNYEIIDWRTVEEQGLFKVKMEVEAKYITKLKPSVSSDEKKSFAQNQTDILKTLTQGKDISNVQEIARLGKQISQIQQQLNAGLNKIYEDSVEHEVHKNITKMEELLRANEFTESYILKMREKMKSLSLELLDDFDMVQKKVVDWIGESIEIAETKVVRPPHVVIIVGPTGVGKTTTLVKLAVQFFLNFKNNPQNQGRKPQICFIVTDFMRVGALEQIERYGEIFDCQVLKAEKSEDLETLYEENKSRMDAIFIDTSGYSPNDEVHIANMKKLLNVTAMRPQIYLAVTASSKARDLENIFKNYELFGYNSVIVTKCDESEQYGNIISVLHKKHKSIAYITNGQIVAKNIQKANPVDFLIRLENFNIDRQHIEDKFGGN